MENLKDKNKEFIERIKKEENIYHENVENSRKVMETKFPLESMTIWQLTIICKPLKRKGDGKMPTKNLSHTKI